MARESDDDDDEKVFLQESDTHLAIDPRSDGRTCRRWRPQRIGWCLEDVPIDCEWDLIDPDRLLATGRSAGTFSSRVGIEGIAGVEWNIPMMLPCASRCRIARNGSRFVAPPAARVAIEKGGGFQWEVTSLRRSWRRNFRSRPVETERKLTGLLFTHGQGRIGFGFQPTSVLFGAGLSEVDLVL